MMRYLAFLVLAGGVSLTAPLQAAEEALDVPRLTAQSRAAIVVISVDGRDGDAQGIGTGFVVDETGLIATNLHVIGEGRPIRVRAADGRQLEVAAIHATDRFQDLAVLRVDPGDQRLSRLELAEGPQPPDGLPIVVIGNPLGLEHSVVEGVVSGVREIDGRQLLQLAVPVEPGNSGGPVLDAAGRVRGIVTMKSAVTDNLGFAVAVEPLKRLLAEPNSIPLNRWLTLGVIDPDRWDSRFGANWRQRGGVIRVEGAGAGFGGRALALSRSEPPERPYEIGVFVRLDDESGAAGLVFHSDGNDKHYGFYPSNGRLRLTCFQGPSVFTWEVLSEQTSAAYRPGEWNHLKVRVGEEDLRCYVNDELVIESADATFAAGKVGLAKFRDTRAKFKGFRVAREIGPSQPDPAAAEQIATLVEGLPLRAALLDEQLEPLAGDAETAADVLRRKARALEAEAGRMRWLADEVHVRDICRQLHQLIDNDPQNFDLLRAALLIARLDNEPIDVDSYVRQVDRMAEEIRRAIPEDSDSASRREQLDKYLFAENGFHGSRFDYHHRANSYLNRVIDDREGLPITLSLLYMALGQRLDIELEGVGLPGHFVVRYRPSEGEPQLVDVFAGGVVLSREDAARRVREITGQSLTEEHLAATTNQAIVLRMLRNLVGLAEAADDRQAVLRYVEATVAVDSESVQHRGVRAVLRFENGLVAAALADLDAILSEAPAGIDLERLQQMRDYFASRAGGE